MSYASTGRWLNAFLHRVAAQHCHPYHHHMTEKYDCIDMRLAEAKKDLANMKSQLDARH